MRFDATSPPASTPSCRTSGSRSISRRTAPGCDSSLQASRRAGAQVEALAQPLANFIENPCGFLRTERQEAVVGQRVMHCHETPQFVECRLVRATAEARIARYDTLDDARIENPDSADVRQLGYLGVDGRQLRLMPTAAEIFCAHVVLPHRDQPRT